MGCEGATTRGEEEGGSPSVSARYDPFSWQTMLSGDVTARYRHNHTIGFCEHPRGISSPPRSLQDAHWSVYFRGVVVRAPKPLAATWTDGDPRVCARGERVVVAAGGWDPHGLAEGVGDEEQTDGSGTPPTPATTAGHGKGRRSEAVPLQPAVAAAAAGKKAVVNQAPTPSSKPIGRPKISKDDKERNAKEALRTMNVPEAAIHGVDAAVCAMAVCRSADKKSDGEERIGQFKGRLATSKLGFMDPAYVVHVCGCPDLVEFRHKMLRVVSSRLPAVVKGSPEVVRALQSRAAGSTDKFAGPIPVACELCERCRLEDEDGTNVSLPLEEFIQNGGRLIWTENASNNTNAFVNGICLMFRQVGREGLETLKMHADMHCAVRTHRGDTAAVVRGPHRPPAVFDAFRESHGYCTFELWSKAKGKKAPQCGCYRRNKTSAAVSASGGAAQPARIPIPVPPPSRRDFVDDGAIYYYGDDDNGGRDDGSMGLPPPPPTRKSSMVLPPPPSRSSAGLRTAPAKWAAPEDEYDDDEGDGSGGSGGGGEVALDDYDNNADDGDDGFDGQDGGEYRWVSGDYVWGTYPAPRHPQGAGAQPLKRQRTDTSFGPTPVPATPLAGWHQTPCAPRADTPFVSSYAQMMRSGSRHGPAPVPPPTRYQAPSSTSSAYYRHYGPARTSTVPPETPPAPAPVCGSSNAGPPPYGTPAQALCLPEPCSSNNHATLVVPQPISPNATSRPSKSAFKRLPPVQWSQDSGYSTANGMDEDEEKWWCGVAPPPSHALPAGVHHRDLQKFREWDSRWQQQRMVTSPSASPWTGEDDTDAGGNHSYDDRVVPPPPPPTHRVIRPPEFAVPPAASPWEVGTGHVPGPSTANTPTGSTGWPGRSTGR